MKSIARKIPFLLLLVEFLKASEDPFDHFLELSESKKVELVEAHNYHRRLISDPEAANMKLMTWDDELASFAKSVARTCDFTHTPSASLNTSFFSTVGENLYSGGKYPFWQMSLNDGITKSWYDEIDYYDYHNRSCSNFCGHFTQVVWADTYKMGCAVAKCKTVKGGSTPYLVACNYGPAGNAYLYKAALPPYISGDACSRCAAGDGCVDQLCNNTARDIPFTTTTTTGASTATTAPEITTMRTPASTGVITTNVMTSLQVSTSRRTGTSLTIPTDFTSNPGNSTGSAATVIRSCIFMNIAFLILFRLSIT